MKVKGRGWNSPGEGQETAGEGRRESRRNEEIAAAKLQTLKSAEEDARARNKEFR